MAAAEQAGAKAVVIFDDERESPGATIYMDGPRIRGDELPLLAGAEDLSLDLAERRQRQYFCDW